MSKHYTQGKVNGYYRLAKIPIKDVFARLLGNGTFTFKIKGKEYQLKAGSLRYHTFHRSLECVNCGKVANVAYIEKSHLSEPIPHVNFYYKDKEGGHTLFTKDHIIPKSRFKEIYPEGEVNCLSNLQTMCTDCNRIKDNKLPHEIENK